MLFILSHLTGYTLSESSFTDRINTEKALPKENRNLDRFNYYATKQTKKSGQYINDFGPEEWQHIQCLDLETCVSILIFAIDFNTYNT
jgi:hypothetical protein